MVLLEDKSIAIPKGKYSKASSFIIERINVPEQIKNLKLTVNVTNDCVKLVLIYDSNYNLRAEVTNIQQKREININEEEALTSIGAKSGRIPDGEWIIAFEANKESNGENCASFSVQAHT